MNAMKGHAVSNGVYVAAANRIGLEKYIEGTQGIQFWGSSFIAGPQGEILAQASEDQEEILMAEVDLDLQENVRQNWPFLGIVGLMPTAKSLNAHWINESFRKKISGRMGAAARCFALLSPQWQ